MVRFTKYRVGNGSKSLGLVFWWNSRRFGIEVQVGVWQLTLMRERS